MLIEVGTIGGIESHLYASLGCFGLGVCEFEQNKDEAVISTEAIICEPLVPCFYGRDVYNFSNTGGSKQYIF